MNTECEALLRVIQKNGISEAENYLLDKSPRQLAKMLISTVQELDKVDSKPIRVTKEEYDRITNLFKIVGIRLMDDGTEVVEQRGRKRKQEITNGE